MKTLAESIRLYREKAGNCMGHVSWIMKKYLEKAYLLSDMIKDTGLSKEACIAGLNADKRRSEKKIYRGCWRSKSIRGQPHPDFLMDQLALKYMPLVSFVVKKYSSNQDMVYGDLMGAGAVGLTKALQSYDSEQSQFSTYARRCIQNEVIDQLRKEQRWAVEQEGNDQWINEVLSDGVHPEAEYISTEQAYEMNIKIRDAIGDLSRREQYVLDNHLLSDPPKAQQYCANYWRCSQQQIAKDVAKIKQLIKENYDG